MSKLKNLVSKLNLFASVRRKKLRKGIENSSMTFLCPNCIGGILFHDLGLKFMSPTVNTMMTQTDFLKFACDLKGYLSKELVFFKTEEYDCPCAYLGDVVIHFTHYATEEEARETWNKRAKRIDYDNLFIIIQERDGLTKEDILKLGQVPARGILAFTANRYDDIKYAVQIKKYEAAGEVGNILKKSHLTERREYEKYFDFVQWFNTANGHPYDVSQYVK